MIINLKSYLWDIENRLLNFLFPKKLVAYILRNAIFPAFKKDVMGDVLIWQNKKYIHPPAMVAGDGPLMQYRIWAQQFYTKKPNIPILKE